VDPSGGGPLVGYDSDMVSGREQSDLEPAIEIIEPLCAVFRRKLKSEGLKYTPERAQVLDTIVRHDGLFDAEMVMAKVKGTGVRVSKATVYRTIKLLQEAGVVHRVLYDGDNAHYLLVYGQTPRAILIPVNARGEPSSQPPLVIEVEVPGLIELCSHAATARGWKLRGQRLHIFVSAP